MPRSVSMALRGGAVTGLVVVALSLLGVGTLFLFFGGSVRKQGEQIERGERAIAANVCPGSVKSSPNVPAPVTRRWSSRRRGELPLDDFPDGTLAHREVAAWHVSEASGWGIVPPTILRDGPFGEGMVQAFIVWPGSAST